MTVIAWVVAPFDHVFPEVALLVKVTEPPWQKVVAPLAVTVGVLGIELTEMVVVADDALQPFELVIVTEYVTAFTTLTACVVAPVDHK